MRGPIRFVSFFAGIGGMDLGLERAGWKCVGQVEIDPYCRKVLAKHWPDVPKMEDVRDVQGHEFGEFDFLVGGFPCQDVSNAGKRAGISAPRSGLYREIVRCLRVVRPLGALLENVAALLRRGMGRVVGDLAEIGYDTEWDCIPAGAVGCTHLRDRVFLVANSSVIRGEVLLRDFTPTRHQAIEGREWPANALDSLCRTLARVEIESGEPSVLRASDGVPQTVDRLRGLGNAVVPQVAEVIGRSIMESWQ